VNLSLKLKFSHNAEVTETSVWFCGELLV